MGHVVVAIHAGRDDTPIPVPLLAKDIVPAVLPPAAAAAIAAMAALAAALAAGRGAIKIAVGTAFGLGLPAADLLFFLPRPGSHAIGREKKKEDIV